MTDRHKNRPKAVRLPDGLEAWYREHAEQTGQPVNALMVQALEEFRAAEFGRELADHIGDIARALVGAAISDYEVDDGRVLEIYESAIMPAVKRALEGTIRTTERNGSREQ